MLYDVYINGEFLDTFDDLDLIKKWLFDMPEWARSVHADQGDVFEVCSWRRTALPVEDQYKDVVRFHIVKDVFNDCTFERC